MVTYPLEVAARTDFGRERAHNEDTFLIAELRTGARHGPAGVSTVLDSASGIVLAAIDACGNGFRAADTAHELTAEVIRAELARAPRPSRLGAALRAASAAIEADQGNDPLRQQQASATLGIVAGDTLHLAHIGGTRAYLLRAGRLARLTRDDTLANDAAELGHVLGESGPGGDGTLVLTRWLGRNLADIGDEVLSLAVRAGDVLLLSTKGLHLMVDDATIELLLVSNPQPAAACDALYDAAMAAGGGFNITIIVARPLGDSLPAALPGETLSLADLPRPPFRRKPANE